MKMYSNINFIAYLFNISVCVVHACMQVYACVLVPRVEVRDSFQYSVLPSTRCDLGLELGWPGWPSWHLFTCEASSPALTNLLTRALTRGGSSSLLYISLGPESISLFSFGFKIYSAFNSGRGYVCECKCPQKLDGVGRTTGEEVTGSRELPEVPAGN